VQNFNEQLNILLMVAIYSLMLSLSLSINMIIVLFGGFVAGMMVLIMMWNRENHRRDPHLDRLIGAEKSEHGSSAHARIQ